MSQITEPKQEPSGGTISSTTYSFTVQASDEQLASWASDPQNQEIECQPLDKVVREWAVMSQFENDQDWYNKLKEQCE